MTHPATDDPVVLHTLAQAMARLGVGRSTLYTLMRSGQIETVHIGRRVLIPSDTIDAFIDSRRQAA